MEKKNMVLLTVIAIATLLVAVVGATFAYFTATITDQRTGDSNTKGQADIQAVQAPSNLLIETSDQNLESFNKKDVYPGHKELVQLKISANGNTNDTYFNIVYKKTENTFPDDAIQFEIYESTKEIESLSGDSAFKCTPKSEVEDEESGKYKLFETCALDENLDNSSGTTHKLETIKLKQNDNTTILNGDYPFVITANAENKTMYYYVVVEYVNKTGESQNDTDSGKKLSGKITVEMAASDSNAIKDNDESKLTKPGE